MNLKTVFSKSLSVDKDNDKTPAYLQLSNIIKKIIASGEFPPGAKLPSEAAIGKHYGLSTMTVRQAIGLVAEQGLLRRIQGSGTYVTTPAWTQASFTWDGLMELRPTARIARSPSSRPASWRPPPRSRRASACRRTGK